MKLIPQVDFGTLYEVIGLVTAGVEWQDYQIYTYKLGFSTRGNMADDYVIYTDSNNTEKVCYNTKINIFINPLEFQSIYIDMIYNLNDSRAILHVHQKEIIADCSYTR